MAEPDPILYSMQDRLETPHQLKPYFTTEGRGARVAFGCTRTERALDFAFEIAETSPGSLASLVVPDQGPGVRRDELWRSTCVEIFVARADGPLYLELNLSPSGDWNVYAFDAYRSGMREARDARAPRLKVERPGPGSLVYRARLEPEALSDSEASKFGEVEQILAGSEPTSLVIGATAVLEYRGERREYWALAHTGAKPDFHLRESFVLRV